MLGEETTETTEQNGGTATDDAGNPITPAISLPSFWSETVDMFGHPVPKWLLFAGIGFALLAAMGKK